MPWRRSLDDRQTDIRTADHVSPAMSWSKTGHLAQNPRHSAFGSGIWALGFGLTCDEIMNALTFKDLMCRNNDELVTRQKFLERKIMSIRPLACRILEDIHDGLPWQTFGLGHCADNLL